MIKETIIKVYNTEFRIHRDSDHGVRKGERKIFFPYSINVIIWIQSMKLFCKSFQLDRKSTSLHTCRINL